MSPLLVVPSAVAFALCADARAAVVSAAGELVIVGPDGRRLASRALSAPCTTVAWDWRGRWLVVGTADGRLLVFALDGAARSRRTDRSHKPTVDLGNPTSIAVGGPVRQLVAHLDGTLAVLVEGGTAITEWDLAAGAVRGVHTASGPIACFCTSENPDADRAITPDNWLDPWSWWVVRLRDGGVEALGGDLRLPSAPGAAVAFDGPHVAVTAGDEVHVVETWGAHAWTRLAGHTAPVTHLTWGAGLVSADASGVVKRWRPTDGVCLDTVALGSPVVALAARGDRVWVLDAAGSLHCLLPSPHPEPAIFLGPSGTYTGSFRGEIRSLPDGPTVRAGCGWRTWYGATPDGRVLACRGRPGQVEVRVGDAAAREIPIGSEREPSAPALSPDGSELLVGVDTEGWTTRCDVATGAELDRTPGGLCAAWSRDGRAWVTLAWGHPARLRLRRRDEPGVAWDVPLPEATPAVVFGDDVVLLVAGGALRAFAVDTGEERWARALAPFRAADHPFTPAAFAVAGSHVACVPEDGHATILDATTGRTVFVGPSVGAVGVVGGAGGPLFAFGALTQRVLVLGLDGLLLDEALPSTPIALAFSGNRLVVATAGGHVLFVPLPSQ